MRHPDGMEPGVTRTGGDAEHPDEGTIHAWLDGALPAAEAAALERAQEAAMARKAVDALAERDRLALLMREEGLDYNEIAEALGLSAGSVGTTLSRARRRLVEAYEALQRGQDERERGGHAAS